MAIKKFNSTCSSISSSDTCFSTEDEAHLHCLLKETILKCQPDDFVEEVQDIPLMLTILHEVINKCDTNSGPFGKSVELIEKIILSLKDEQDILRKLPILPVLTDILLRSTPSRNEYVLKLIQDVSFGIVIKTCQPYIERLIKFCVKLLCDDTVESNDKLQNVALSVLINLCSKNAISLNILEEQINLIDLQKKIPLKTYGILTCKMNLILNEGGNILRDSDVRNFLKFTSKELHRIPSLDEKLLKHLIEFIREIAQRSNTKEILQEYDFSAGIQAAIMTLENVTDNHKVHVNSLFEIIKIVTIAKNNSLKSLVITVINFGIKRLSNSAYRIQALETLATIFNNDAKISTNIFELEEMQETLKALLYSNERHPTIMAPLFKLLNVLAQNYKLNLMNNQVVDSIFSPLRQLESSSYFKLPLGDINMYLECLATLSTLLENNIFETKSNLFQETNIQFLVAMSIKHGNTDQCCLALSLMKRFSKQKISEIISAKSNDSNLFDPHLFLQNNKSTTVGIDLSKQLGIEKVKNVFKKIETACANEKFEVPTSDFIELYTNEITMLKQKIEILTKKYEDVSDELDLVKGNNLQLEITSMKWSELGQNLQKSVETLRSDNEKLNTIVTSLRSQIKSSLGENEEAVRKLAQESKKNKEMEVKVTTLEEELKDTEDMRQTILSLMSKRKKTSGKDS
ncbi:uncharacterized protein LOC129569906 [Sitodiplosis mosellana]|uniref:uncharacterized protein LOC129569906 n=1 Tax=Sitodiplosis mosellana TaxID=263140 RepID=UPI002444907B|nr:uncharacterized protein LOC129569906 [Sitodiplosis mosellana]